MSAKAFSEVTPAWLTAILTKRSGLLAGRVLRVEQTRDPNPITQIATLLLTYFPNTQKYQGWAAPGRAGRVSSARRSPPLQPHYKSL